MNIGNGLWAMDLKRTLNAIKIARAVLEQHRSDLEILALTKNNNAVAMAALLFLESVARHSSVNIDLAPVQG